MDYSKTSIREAIRQIIRENFSSLLETQKGKKIDIQANNLFSKLKLDVFDGSMNTEFITKEVRKSLDLKINKVLQSQYEYPNLYIVKLGGFVLKDNEGTRPLSFSMEGFKKNFTYPYLYIYHDTAIVLKFASRFFDSDEIIKREAEKFLETNGIHLNTMHEQGNKVIFDTTFDTNNLIDIADYLHEPEPEEKTPALAKEKSDYRVGATVKHPVFGKGKIKKTKRHGIDDEGNTIYDVTIDFGGKEKTLRMKEKIKAS